MPTLINRCRDVVTIGRAVDRTFPSAGSTPHALMLLLETVYVLQESSALFIPWSAEEKHQNQEQGFVWNQTHQAMDMIVGICYSAQRCGQEVTVDIAVEACKAADLKAHAFPEVPERTSWDWPQVTILPKSVNVKRKGETILEV